MAGSLDDELKRASEEVEAVASGLQASIRKVHVDAADAIVRLIDEADARKSALLVRISYLNALVGTEPTPVPVEVVHEPKKPGLSATEAILTALLDGPKSANALDAAVMAQGLSKASAEKAKWTCRHNGWASHSKRIWKITPAGSDKILGQDSTQET